MKINAVACCVQYSDYLCWALPTWRNCFDHLVIVSSKDDLKTKQVCSHWNVQCLQSDVFYHNGAKFNKGLGIQLGLDYLKSDDWCVHLDADIVLPPRFNEFIHCKKLNKDHIYGIDRLDIKDWDTWLSFYCNPVSQTHLGSTWANFPLMYRVHQGYEYNIIGYFQMWNCQSKFYKGYPLDSQNAAGSDLTFNKCWPAENRILIPEVFVYHLSSEGENKQIGLNWNSRQSNKFGPYANNVTKESIVVNEGAIQ